MKPINDVDLKALVQETAEEIVSERRKQAAGQIKKMLQTSEQLSKELADAEKLVLLKKAALDKNNEKIQKLREGDWTVLQDPAPDKPEKKEEKPA